MTQIQSLSNSRQRLYAAKWTRRNRADYQEKIKRLDSQIADLWHEHRVELAHEKHPVSASLRHEKPVMAALAANQDALAVAEDYLELVGKSRPISGHQINLDGKWTSVDDTQLTQAVGRYVAEIPDNIPGDDPDEYVPLLRDVLKRRGQTLRFYKTESGHTYGRVVSLSS